LIHYFLGKGAGFPVCGNFYATLFISGRKIHLHFSAMLCCTPLRPTPTLWSAAARRRFSSIRTLNQHPAPVNWKRRPELSHLESTLTKGNYPLVVKG
jgi:hypothetical protein